MKKLLNNLYRKIKGDFMNTPRTMQVSIVALIIVAMTTIFLSGCAFTCADKNFIEANFEAAELFGNELKEYIENDSAIPAESKERRIKSIESWQGSTKTALEAHK